MTVLIFFKTLTAILLAVIGTIIASRWITCLYQKNNSILSYPESLSTNSRYRRMFLPFILGTIFCWQLITLPDNILPMILKIFGSYFLLLFTITDIEQEVIFDAMQLPFVILGLFFTLMTEMPITNHLTAALGGGFIFLIIAILTRGGIGGGDIKLIAALGIWFGTEKLLTIACIGFLMGGLFAFGLLISKRKKRTDYFAYGPFFTLTALFYFLF